MKTINGRMQQFHFYSDKSALNDMPCDYEKNCHAFSKVNIIQA